MISREKVKPYDSFLRRYEPMMPKVFARFYAVGLVLYILPFTRGLFVSITSLSLLLVITVVFLYHSTWNGRTIGWFLFIIFSSFFLEMAGVHTGTVFGAYSYDRGLAPLVSGTPLIIGLNWLFLVYASRSIVMRYTKLNAVLRVVVASILMLAYDLLLEWVAPFMNMWHFVDGFAPFRNFVVWFAAAAIYQTGFEVFAIQADNLSARALFVLQMLFFVGIGVYSTFFIR